MVQIERIRNIRSLAATGDISNRLREAALKATHEDENLFYTAEVLQPLAEVREMFVERYTEEDVDYFDLAAHTLLYAHQGHTRDSGEAYIQHCVRVAKGLIERERSANAVIAGLDHDVPEDSESNGVPVDENDLFAIFSQPWKRDGLEEKRRFRAEHIVRLIKGCRNSEWEESAADRQAYLGMNPREIKAEQDRRTSLKNFRNVSGENGADPEVIFIKLEDRVDNMKTIFGKNSPYKRYLKAIDTFEVSAALAEVIGEYELHDQLTDLAFHVLQSDWFLHIAETIKRAADSSFDIQNDDLDRLEKIMSAFHTFYDIQSLTEEIQSFLRLKCTVSLPALYGLKETWKQKDKKSQFRKSDLYAKTHIVLPDRSIEEKGDIRDYSGEIFESFFQNGWEISEEHNSLNYQSSHDEVSVFLIHKDTGRLLKVKCIRESTYVKKNTRIAGLYQIGISEAERIQQLPDIVNKLLRLGRDYQLLASGGAESTKVLNNLVENMGGIRVIGTQGGEITPLPQDEASVLLYASKIRPSHMFEIGGFRINDGDIQHPDQVLTKLHDGDKVQIYWLDHTSDREALNLQKPPYPRPNVLPRWLLEVTDPFLLEKIGEHLDKKLERMKKKREDVQQYEQWMQEIKGIGIAKLQAEMLFPEMIDLSQGWDGLSLFDDYRNLLGFSSHDDLLKAVAYGRVIPSDLYGLIDSFNTFLNTHIILDFAYPSIHALQENFRAISVGECKLKLVRSEGRMLEDRTEYTRYFFDLSNPEGFFNLIKRLAGFMDKKTRLSVLRNTEMVFSHYPPEVVGENSVIKQIHDQYETQRDFLGRHLPPSKILYRSKDRKRKKYTFEKVKRERTERKKLRKKKKSQAGYRPNRR